MDDTSQQTNWKQIPVETLNPLMSRQFVHGAQAMLARIELKKGCLVPRHAHANEQISYVVSGALRFLVGEAGEAVEKILRAGDVLVLPGHLPHSAEALEDTVEFDIFSPPRQDWLDKDDSYLR
jgi:quercetin dioxygenase-like cupin family protein